jgi:hypothetical protein
VNDRFVEREIYDAVNKRNVEMYAEIERLNREIERMQVTIENLYAETLGPKTALPAAPEKTWDVPSGWRGKKPWFKVGDKVLPLSALHRWYPVHTITELTSRGFKYSHARFSLGTRIGWTEGGETFEPSQYELAAAGQGETT